MSQEAMMETLRVLLVAVAGFVVSMLVALSVILWHGVEHWRKVQGLVEARLEEEEEKEHYMALEAFWRAEHARTGSPVAGDADPVG